MRCGVVVGALLVVGCTDSVGAVPGAGGADASESSSGASPSTSSGAQTLSSGEGGTSSGASVGSSGSSSGATSGSTGAGSDTDSSSTGAEAQPFIAVTFNTGGHAEGESDVADAWYGNGLSWNPAIEQTQAWIEALQPDVITFQELFHPGDCVEIPASEHAGYVCEGWGVGDPTVAQMILGEGYQVACNLGKPDKCAAVKTSFGAFIGCDAPLCLDGLDGAEVEDCGSGSRVGRARIELVDGGTLTVVNVHGTSGILPADQLCRVAQFEQVFVDLDGTPAADGERNLILGDFNTDPVRASALDLSAQRLGDFVGDGRDFAFVTEVGEGATPTYVGVFNIDHVVSDSFTGTCWHPGITPGDPPVVDFEYFDHVPAVCELFGRD